MSKDDTLIIIDADPIVYRAGFAGQEDEIEVVYSLEDDDDNLMWETFYRDKGKTANQNLKEWKAEHPEYVIQQEERIVIPEPLPMVLSTVKAMIRDCIKTGLDKFGDEFSDASIRVLLSGPDNFRHDIATVAPYKGNRDDAHRPVYYQQIRNYMTEFWDAEVISGREADDECSIAQRAWNGNSIICTIDKDLDQVPGWHYDYWKKVLYFTEEHEGELLFFKQVLKGDSTDNIPGCHRVGDLRADAIVDELYVSYGMDREQIWSGIVDVYAKSLKKFEHKCKYYDKAMEEGVEAVVIEMARLVKMQDYLGQLWTPPGQPDELLEMEFEE